MSHQYACPHCHECLGPNAREVPRVAYCANCGETNTNHDGWRACPTCNDDCGYYDGHPRKCGQPSN